MQKQRGLMTVIRVTDGDEVYSFVFDDLLKFHGTKSICWLTISFKIMEGAWAACWMEDLPLRDEISVQSGFPGSGTRDGFELVTQASSRGVYDVLSAPPLGPLVAEAAIGSYFFRISTTGKSVDLGLKPEVVPDGFVSQRRHLQSGDASEVEISAFRRLQYTFSDQLRALQPAEAVNVLSISGLSQ